METDDYKELVLCLCFLRPYLSEICNDMISEIGFRISQWGQEWREVFRCLNETRLVTLSYFIYLKVSIIKRFFTLQALL